MNVRALTALRVTDIYRERQVQQMVQTAYRTNLVRLSFALLTAVTIAGCEFDTSGTPSDQTDSLIGTWSSGANRIVFGADGHYSRSIFGVTTSEGTYVLSGRTLHLDVPAPLTQPVETGTKARIPTRLRFTSPIYLTAHSFVENPYLPLGMNSGIIGKWERTQTATQLDETGPIGEGTTVRTTYEFRSDGTVTRTTTLAEVTRSETGRYRPDPQTPGRYLAKWGHVDLVDNNVLADVAFTKRASN